MPAYAMSAFQRTLLLVTAFLVPQLSTLAQSGNGIAAVVNGRVITRSEVREAIKAQEQMIAFQFQHNPSERNKALAEMRSHALDSIIDRELILAEFARMGARLPPYVVDDAINNIIRENFKGNRDAFIKELARSGMTFKKFRDLQEKMVIVQAMRAKFASDQSPATPREVENFYKKNVDKWRKGGMVKIATISIPKYTGDAAAGPESQKKLAQEIRSKLVKGADFGTMAKTYSQDSRAEQGGSSEWMDVEKMPPAIGQVAFGLPTGGISSIIDEQGVYIIILCEAKRLGEAPALSKIRPEIEKMIQQERSKGSVENWMKDLRRKATIRKM